MRECHLDQRFGLVTWNEHRGGHSQRQSPELAHAGEIGHRLAVASASCESEERARRFGREKLVSVRDQPRAIAREDVRQQRVRVDRHQARSSDRAADRQRLRVRRTQAESRHAVRRRRGTARLRTGALACCSQCSIATAATLRSRQAQPVPNAGPAARFEDSNDDARCLARARPTARGTAGDRARMPGEGATGVEHAMAQGDRDHVVLGVPGHVALIAIGIAVPATRHSTIPL